MSGADPSPAADSGLPLGINSFLAVAVAAAGALAERHETSGFHGELGPATIVLDAGEGTASIKDPGPAGAPRDGRRWAYISPEQTGRLQRPIDGRSDLYSLGILLYELLTGMLPFEAADPLEWVHRHLAVAPRPPSAISASIPAVVSDILLRALAKDPDDRYQSARGLQHDLERSLEQWRRAGAIAPFAFGERDWQERFLIPQRLYGRDEERAALERALAETAASHSPRVVLVTGGAGAGKSALVRELVAPVADLQGLFLAGKFDEGRRGVPYAPIVQAFRDLAGLILAGSEERVASWRERLQGLLGANGRLITDLLPEMELILGLQASVALLSPAEAHHRFAAVFRRFVGTFAVEHPLVLFLDDLQWADAASLRLLADVAADRSLGSVLIVAAFRDAEVDGGSPLAGAVEQIEQAGTPLETLTVGPLDAESLGNLIGDALRIEREAAAPLQQLVLEITHGNPLFATQLLVDLTASGLIRFDRHTTAWSWDPDRIRAAAFSDNVLDLMAERLARCTAPTQSALSLAACLGSSFAAEELATVAAGPVEELVGALEEGVAEGLVVRSPGGYRFRHDRILEVAYSRIPEAERAATHLRIGRSLLAGMSPESPAERIFSVVGQLNAGITAMGDPAQRLELARLNRLAARRAWGAAAFGTASEHSATGLALLGPEGWATDDELAFDLTRTRAECELFAGNLEEVERLLKTALEHARTRLERAQCRRIEIDMYTTRGDTVSALGAALACLRLYDLELPARPSREHVDEVDRRLVARLGDRGVERFLELPVADDPEIEAALDVLAGLMPGAYFMDLHLHRLIACHILELTLGHGMFAASTIGLGAYALERCIAGSYADGDRAGRVALTIADRHGFATYRAELCMLLGSSITIWTREVHTGIGFTREAARAGLEIGDILSASLSRTQELIVSFAAGEPLERLEDDADEVNALMRRAGFHPLADCVVVLRQLIRCLRGRTDAPASLSGPDFDEAAFGRTLASHPLPLIQTIFHSCALEARVYGGDAAGAVTCADAVEPVVVLMRGQHVEVDAALFGVLARGAAWDGASAEQRAAWLPQIRAQAARLEGWGASCPENFGHRASLAAAELARVEGREAQALDLYVRAGRQAKDHGFVQVEALAHERAASACRGLGLDASADAHLREAHACYVRWGALGKARQLEVQFPALVAASEGDGARVGSGGLDVLAVAKASQAISGEIVLERLLEKLLDVVIAHVGARRAALLVARPEGLVVAATAEPRGAAIAATIHDPPLALAPELVPGSVIHHVARAREPLILGNAAEHGPFTSDPYVVGRRSKSILCAPIVAQADLRGLVYAENDLIVDAFTSERLGVLEVLAGQAAISLENATLYGDLRREIAERERTEAGLRSSEAQLRQAQKMEAVGRLAGGIAHDFNNVLTAILGYGMLAFEQLGADDPVREDILEIQRAGERAATLTRQLLAFSRTQVLEARPLDLGAVLEGLDSMLRRLIGDDVELVCEYAPELGVVHADPGQVEQIIVNLALNARDAMPEGGTLTIATGHARLDAEAAASQEDAEPGDYVTLTVTDDGAGMDPETSARIFEPFFTTKQPGEGTGLGLSTVYGIVRQSGGHLAVASTPERGTSFVIRLPRTLATTAPAAVAVSEQPSPAGTETILLVEDEEPVRTLLRGSLARLGYTVIEARDPRQALELHARHAGPVDLMISDVVMPGGSGPELARRLAPLAPGMKVLFISGHAPAAVLQGNALDGTTRFLQKPFTPNALARKVRELLDAG